MLGKGVNLLLFDPLKLNATTGIFFILND